MHSLHRKIGFVLTGKSGEIMSAMKERKCAKRSVKRKGTKG